MSKAKSRLTTRLDERISAMAGVAGLEPTTHGFGDHCSTN